MREVHEAELAGEGLFSGMRAADMTIMGSVRSEGFTTELALGKKQEHLTNTCTVHVFMSVRSVNTLTQLALETKKRTPH